MPKPAISHIILQIQSKVSKFNALEAKLAEVSLQMTSAVIKFLL